MSGDSTSRRNINYQSHHITYKVLERQADGTVRMSDLPKTSFHGIRSTVDHTAGMSFDSWHRTWMESADMPRHIMHYLRGMCSDHASAEKATADAIRDAKRKDTLQEMGEEARDEMSAEDFEALVGDWSAEKIRVAGGADAWNALTKEEQAIRDLVTIEAVIQSLGQKEVDKLPEAERRLLMLFVWTGCCMHKDQNSFKGGNTAMMATWAELGLTPPIPLANKANAEAVRKAVAPETGSRPLTDDEVSALESSTRGAVKTTALAHHHGARARDAHAPVPANQQHTFRVPRRGRQRANHEPARVHQVPRACQDEKGFRDRARRPRPLHAADQPPVYAARSHARVRCAERHRPWSLACGYFGADSYLDATFDGQEFERPEVVNAIQRLVEDGRLPHPVALSMASPQTNTRTSS